MNSVKNGYCIVPNQLKTAYCYPSVEKPSSALPYDVYIQPTTVPQMRIAEVLS